MMDISLPLSIFLRAVLNVGLAWGMAAYLPGYIGITGGLGAYVVIGSLLTLMNLFVRPLLNLITFPLRLVMTLVALILVNAVFLWITLWVVRHMDPALVTMQIKEGIMGWVVVSGVIGLGNWAMKVTLR